MKKLAALLLSALLLAGCNYSPSARDTVYVIKAAGGGNGSGVLVAPSRMLTAAHVAKFAQQQVLWVEYKEKRVSLEVLKIDEEKDIALVEVLGVECPCAPLAEASPQLDEPVYTIGYPAYSAITTQIKTEGKTQGLNQVRKMSQFTTPAGPGNSGGGVFNRRGELVGILSSAVVLPYGFMGVFPLNHIIQAVSIETIKRFLFKDVESLFRS